MTKYNPVSCELHSELELAIMHKKQLQLQVSQALKQEHVIQITPLDIYTKEKAEYLKGIQTDETVIDIRLDYITKYETIS